MALETRHSEPGPAHKGEPVSIKESWVQCDRCDKWRRVPASLAESLDEDAPWYCEHNVGRYNSCSMPQEMTDAEIDDGPETAPGPGAAPQSPADLNDGGRALAALRRTPIWQLVTEKLYTYRRRHVQDEDDIMICQCPHIWPSDTTTVGCGERCLNRMLNIECVPGYCPCGDRCTNQQFSRREYAPLEVRRAGAKGFGLFTRDGVRAGQFIVEYVGEVLDEEEYARRRAFYLAAGQRHYYFMNIGNGEVIDACRRGGLGRFINHSCEPNCETQKWQVGGELSIGLFALRDVLPGGELTFDYNFERYGDKPMRCLCGAATCRGVIGGGAAVKAGRAEENVVEDDAATLHASSHLDPEPIMLSGRPSPALDRLLDRVVGIGAGAPFTPAERKLLDSLRRRQREEAGAEVGARPPSPPSAPEDESADEQVALLERGAVRQTGAPVVEDKESDSSVTSRLGSSADGSGRGGPTPSKLSASEEEGSDDSAAAADENAGLAAWSSQRRAPRPRAGRQAPDARRGLAATPRRVRTPPPATPARSGGAAPAAPAARRSEVDRRLDALVEASTGRLRSSAPDCVLGLLRLFNLCDVGALLVGLGAGASDAGAALRLRARLADLSLLLEVLLRTKRADARRELVRCGALQQLLSVLGGGLAASTGTAEATVAAKLLRAVRELCSGPQDLRGARSAHGSFLDEVRRLVRHSARVVRDAAHELLRAVVPLSDNGGGDCYVGGAASNFSGAAYGNGGATYSTNNITNGTYNTYAPSHTAMPSSILSTSSSSPGHRGFAPGRGSVVPPPASSPFGKAPLGTAPSHFSRSPSISRFGERVAARAGSGPLARAASTSSLVAPPAARSPAARSPAEARVVPGRHKRSRWDDSTRRTSWHAAPPEAEPSWTSARSEHALAGAGDTAGGPAPPGDYGDPAFFSARMPQREAAAATWDEPDADFAAYVSAVVACRVGKYLQPDHPSRLSRRQAEQVHRRLSRDIFAKEQEAYRERQATHLFKAIEREKIDARIKEYVRDSVHRLAAQGGLQPGADARWR